MKTKITGDGILGDTAHAQYRQQIHNSASLKVLWVRLQCAARRISKKMSLQGAAVYALPAEMENTISTRGPTNLASLGLDGPRPMVIIALVMRH
jgi:hypothetical protein